MEHTEIRRQLSAYRDGEVTPAQRREIDAHLAACPRCRAALAELERTIGLIRGVPRVEPPPWLAAKTMARVREVAEARPSLWQRLFFPLWVKLPLETVAIVFLCVTGYYLTRSMAPELTKVPSPAPTRQEEAPPAPARPGVPAEDVEAPRPAVPRQSPPSPLPVPRKSSPPPAESPAAPAATPEMNAASPVAPVPAPAAPAAQLREAPPAVMEEQAPSGFTSGPAAASKSSAKKAKKAQGVAPLAAEAMRAAPEVSRHQAVLGVEDLAAAETGATEAVRRAGGTVLRRETTSAETVLTVRVDAARLPDLLARLERLGTLRRRPGAETAAGASVELTIRLEPNR